MKTLTQSKIETINSLVEKFETQFPEINIYQNSNSTRSVVSDSVDSKIKFAIYKSEAAYKRFYGSGCNAYRVYINNQLLNFIQTQATKYKKYSILVA